MQVGRIISGGTREVARRGIVKPAAVLRRWKLIYRIKLNAWLRLSTVDVQIGRDIRIGKRIQLEASSRSHTVLRIGKGCQLGDGVRLRLRGGDLLLGDVIDIRGNAVLGVDGGRLVLDGPNNISWGVTIHCSESIHLAKFAHVAEYTTIVDNSHFYSDPDGWSYHNLRTAPIELQQDVWVCPKATITSGVTIGDHTIVASNTVVVKDVPAGVLISGVPGKVIRELDLPWKQ